MARKVRLHLTIPWVICAIIALSLSGAIIRINPAATSALSLTREGTPILARPPFPAPKNVQIVRWPDDTHSTHVRITWDPVPGATSYQVYTAIAVPDSSKYIAVVEPRFIPDGSIVWGYKHSKHPIFGDVMFFRPEQQSAPMQAWSYGGPGSGTVALFSAFTPDTLGVYDGCSFVRPLAGERDRFFYVRALR